MGKKWLDVDNLGLIFKDTQAHWISNFDQNKAYLHSFPWTKWWILAKLYVLHHWDNLKNWLDFGDLYLIFNLTTLYLMNQLVDFDQTYKLDMGKKWLDFGVLDLIFKVTPALWMSNFDPKKSLSSPYLLNKNDGFWPIFMYCIVGLIKRFD